LRWFCHSFVPNNYNTTFSAYKTNKFTERLQQFYSDRNKLDLVPE
jgi:hypothetical protein